MKKILFLILFFICLASTAHAFGWGGKHQKSGNHPGGGGTPEPITMILIGAGGAGAVGLKRLMGGKKKDNQ